MKKLRTIIVTIALVFAVFPTVAFAQQRCTFTKSADGKTIVRADPDLCPDNIFIPEKRCSCCGDCKLEDFTKLGISIARFIFGIAGSLALLMFVYGGFYWVTSAGRADAYEKGKKAMVAATVGLLIIFGAWMLVNTILAALTGQIGSQGVAKVFTGQWAEWSPQSEAPRK